ncbi:Uncharacterized protein FKW44_020106 [Caligus rogercresseyi]|uniref:Uncharacterized protein n=1 Tax=Caligus rogercresseyi TaxID=217165 RepID=A0A7T8JXZ1_CALRO|nr:Uncharacterized protein FKW44_020106 [Caligus rogercresseyi]
MQLLGAQIFRPTFLHSVSGWTFLTCFVSACTFEQATSHTSLSRQRALGLPYVEGAGG